jgi:hypothetical protein
MLARNSRCVVGFGPIAFSVGLLIASFARADSPSSTDSSSTKTTQAIGSLIDRLPDLLDLGIPGFAPGGAFRLYTNPRFGDLLHEDYFRLPVGVRYQATDHLELTSELGSYFTHGLRDSVGYGLYELRVGAKHEKPIGRDAAWGVGADFVTPLSRPPHDITDGMRHIVPYLSGTRTLVEDKQILGFGSLAADLISRTELAPNFHRNELHSDSLVLTVGAAREWRRFRVILATSVSDTTLLSGESKQVYAFRPSLVIPILRRPDSSARATVTFAGRVVSGPDGTELGINTSVRIDLKYRPKNRVQP